MPQHNAPVLSRDELTEKARKEFASVDDTQSTLAREIGASQSEVSRALKGQNTKIARRIVEHYTGKTVESGFVVRE